MGVSYILGKSKILKRITNIIIIFILLLFMLVAGLDVSVIRACIMGSIMIGAKIFYKKLDIWTSIAISLLIVLINNPFTINNIGLQLSYTGVIGIILFNKIIEETLQKIFEKYVHIGAKIIKSIIQGLSVTISAQILLMPILAYSFNTFSFTFFISNLFAVPLAGITMIIGFMNVAISFISFNLSTLMGIILNLFLELLMLIARLTSAIPFSNLIIVTPHKVAIVIYYLIVFLFYIFYQLKIRQRKFFPWNIKINKMKIFAILILLIFSGNFISFIYRNINEDLIIHFIDVGQR